MSILPLILKDVTVRFGERAVLDRINLEISSGPKTVILGPNGAGKSLLLRLCHGLFGPFEGQIRWTGPDARNARHRQGMVFQKPVMLRRSVCANVDYGLKLHGMPPDKRRAKIEWMLDRTGLTHAADHPARVLSVGEQQRLALARAWALDPEILFLDEPTAGLDPIGAHDFDTLIGDLQRTLGLTVVMITHDLDSLYAICDRVAVLLDKRVKVGTIDALSSEPDPWIRDYFHGPRARAAQHGSTTHQQPE